ncbi:hypothetical protein KFZ76_11675 [Methylovulum psychrotolerans]|uniref:hypothetical protein n=1 Tax=Methylovulum psychrotolerans TaxID=1704499 RepID=UPI001BFFA8DA|nr:hypothetical protein [Methylovulum psychrotolerans]MBT9098365.1 hypothetical protein [Methylovulum psychrotolerans]
MVISAIRLNLWASRNDGVKVVGIFYALGLLRRKDHEIDFSAIGLKAIIKHQK